MKLSSGTDFRVEKRAVRKKQARRALQADMEKGKAGPGGLAALKSGALKNNAVQEDSKAVGKQARRGRPRMEGKLREPNGRVSRAAQPPSLLALQARAFHTGLTLEQAKDPRAETYLGRLAIFGRGDGLSRDQYEAAQQFLQLRNEYQRSLLSPGAYYEATGIRLQADNMAEYEAWAARVKKRYSGALKAVQEAQIDNGRENLYAALQYVIIEDLELPYLLGAVRMALNALHRHFKRFNPNGGKGSWLDKHSISLAGMAAAPKALQ